MRTKIRPNREAQNLMNVRCHGIPRRHDGSPREHHQPAASNEEGCPSWGSSCGSSRTYFNPTGLRSRACFLTPQRTQLHEPRSDWHWSSKSRRSAYKMSAGALEQLIRSAPSSTRPPQDVRCLPTQGGWDYICLHQTDGPQPRTLKIGVRVSAYAIVQASTPQPPDTPLVSPQPVAR